jgi:parallel beta-helix repeat protein
MLLAAVTFGLLNAQIYASAYRGDDRNDGLSKNRPIRTLEHAMEIARARNSGEIDFHLDGRFVLKAPLVVDRSSIAFIGDTQSAAITGATSLSNWQLDSYNGRQVWSMPVPSGLTPREMFVGESMERVERPRLPEAGFYRFAGLTGNAMNAPWNQGQTEALFRPQDVPRLKNPQDVEVVAHHFWVTSRMPLQSVDEQNHLFHFAKKSVFRLSDDYTGQPAPYYLDNVGEALHKPGQWYWDRAKGKIFYVPRPSDVRSKLVAWVPELTNLMTIRNASNVRVSGINFSGCEYNLPPDSAGDGQAAISVPGAIALHNADSCSISCTVHACGTYGIEVTGTSNHNTIQCGLVDLGAGGVKLGPGTSYNAVTNCLIAEDDKVHASGVGVWIGNSGHNTVSRNKILNLTYTGISVGWTWGYGPSDAVDNSIEWNRIMSIGEGLLSDMGGIYTLGVSPGTVIAHNHITDVRSYGYGGWGIYLDEGSSNILVEDNLVEECKTGSFHQHYGRDNVIRNNIFAFAQTEGQIIRSRPEDHNSFDMEHNVIVWDGKTPLFGGNLTGPGFVFRDNYLYCLEPRNDFPKWMDPSNRFVRSENMPGARQGDYRLSFGPEERYPGFEPFRIDP